MAKSTSTKGFLLGALAGAVVGSVTALLFAPKSGKELRSDIAEGAHKVGDTTSRFAHQVGETTGRLAKQVGDGASEVADRAKQAASNVMANVKSWRGGSDIEEKLEEAIVSTLTAGIESSEQEEVAANALAVLEPETEQIEEAQPAQALQTIGY
ncbi:YtxH domain-containing protein [Paenibacillus kobensis]|uniref:YtxH domain-containing protein n=1 Tax=Paenibacillus kobensis TaxID=59841 RepID=UPI000FD6D67B|nr:YtxH domain-containing protein [Paenibacillus kobensis]